MSDSVRPHRWQPTRLPLPWNSPGKNTAVGCHFLLQCIKVKSESEVAQSCPTLATPWTAAYQAPPSMRFSRQDTGVGCHCLLRSLTSRTVIINHFYVLNAIVLSIRVDLYQRKRSCTYQTLLHWDPPSSFTKSSCKSLIRQIGETVEWSKECKL